MKSLPIFCRIRSLESPEPTKTHQKSSKTGSLLSKLADDSGLSSQSVFCSTAAKPNTVFVSESQAKDRKSSRADSNKKRLIPLKFECQEVFGPGIKNRQIFKRVMEPLIQNISKSISSCLLVVGSIASGKKHTLLNTDELRDSKGLIQAAFEEIRATVEPEWRSKGIDRVSRTVQVCAICNGDVYDLIGNKYANFKIIENFQSPFHEVFSSGVTEKNVKNAKELTIHITSALKNFPVTSSRDRSLKRSPVFITIKLLDETDGTIAPVYLTFLIVNSDEIWRPENIGATRDLLGYLSQVRKGERNPEMKGLYLKNKLTTVLRPSLHEDSSFTVLGAFHPKSYMAAKNTIDFLERLDVPNEEFSQLNQLSTESIEEENFKGHSGEASLGRRDADELENDIDDLYYEMIGAPGGLDQERLRDLVLGFEYRAAQILERMKNMRYVEEEGKSRRQRDNLEKMKKVQEMLVCLLDNSSRRKSIESPENQGQRGKSGTGLEERKSRSSSPEEISPNNLERLLNSNVFSRGSTIEKRPVSVAPKPIIKTQKIKKPVNMAVYKQKNGSRDDSVSLRHSYPPTFFSKKGKKRSTSTGTIIRNPFATTSLVHGLEVSSSPRIKENIGSPLRPLTSRINQTDQLYSSGIALKSNLATSRTEISFAKHEISSLQEQIAILADRERQLMRHEDLLSKEVASLQSRLSSKSKELEIAHETNYKLEEKLKDLQNKRDLKLGVIEDLERALKNAKENEERAIQAEEEIRNKFSKTISDSASQIEENLAIIRSLQNDNKEILNRNRDLEIELQTIREKVVETKQQASQTIEEILAEKNAEIVKKEEKIRKLKKSIKIEQKKTSEVEKREACVKEDVVKIIKEKENAELDLANAQVDMGEIKKEIASLQREIERLLNENKEITKRHKSTMGQCGEVEREAREKQQTIQRYEQKLYEAENEIQSNLEILEKFKRDLRDLKEDRDKLRTENNDLKKDMEFMEKSQNAGIDMIERRVNDLSNEILALREERETLLEGTEQLNREIEGLIEEKEDLEEKLHKSKRKAKKLKKRLYKTEVGIENAAKENAEQVHLASPEAQKKRQINLKVQTMEEIQEMMKGHRDGMSKAKKVLELLG